MIAWALLLAGLAAADEPPVNPCVQQYKAEYSSVWELSSQAWAAGCTKGALPQTLLTDA